MDDINFSILEPDTNTLLNKVEDIESCDSMENISVDDCMMLQGIDDRDVALELLNGFIKKQTKRSKIFNKVKVKNPKTAVKVYVLCTGTDTLFGKVIRGVTSSSFSHVAMAVDNDMAEFYSYNLSSDAFVIETPESYGPMSTVSVYSVLVDKEVGDKVIEICKDLCANVDKTSYSAVDILKNLFGIGDDTQSVTRVICTQFIANVLARAGVELFNIPNNLVKPEQFAKHPSLKFEVRGLMRNFEKLVERMQKKRPNK